MGNCIGPETEEERIQRMELKEAKIRSRQIDREMLDEEQKQKAINKLLLLGAGDSGKSTLFKQMRCIYGSGYSEKERKTFYTALCNNIICCMKALCKQTDKYGTLDEKMQAYKNQILDLGTNEDDLQKGNVGFAIKSLWDDPVIRKTYDNSYKFYLSDSARYFFDKIGDVMQPDYVPTQEDVFRTRIPTTGIVERSFLVDGHVFQMFDVGGQRSERKKWIHCFENVTSVIFVAALSAYDQVLYEDEETNRMKESLELFGSISGMKWFLETPFILFLNKCDLFEEKLKNVLISDHFPEYSAPNEFKPGCQFIEDMFVAKDTQHRRDIYPHITCATNTDTMKTVFEAVKDIIIKRGLAKAGLV